MPRRVPLILLVALSAIVIVQAQNSSVQVQASPDYVLKEENITVTWKGVSVAYEYDYIALISPPDALKNGGLLGLRYAVVHRSIGLPARRTSIFYSFFFF
jgi:hypothetical protein